MMTVTITQFGAKANAGLQTQAIQRAIDHVFVAGGGEVQIPAGTFLTGSIRLRSRVTLHLLENAVLQGSRDPEDYFGYVHDTVEPLAADQITDAPYVGLWTIHGETAYDETDPRYRFKRLPGSRWNNALIRAMDAEQVAILGEPGSVIDGCDCFDAMGEEEYRGPHAIGFFRVKNITLRGYTLKNSANWAHHLLFCENVLAEDLTVLAGHDGFDVAVSSNISVQNCAFYTGDDCIAGFGNTNVRIADCLLNSSCSGMRFGGTNVLVRDCRFVGPGKYLFRGSLTAEEKRTGVIAEQGEHRRNMLSAFTYYADYSVPIPELPGNIILRDCEFDGVDRFLHYNFSGNETWQRYRPMTDITFENIRATSIAMPLAACGTAEYPLQLTLKNVSVAIRQGSDVPCLIRASHCSCVALEDVSLRDFAGECLVRNNTDSDYIFRSIESPLSEADYVQKTDEPFYAKAI